MYIKYTVFMYIKYTVFMYIKYTVFIAGFAHNLIYRTTQPFQYPGGFYLFIILTYWNKPDCWKVEFLVTCMAH